MSKVFVFSDLSELQYLTLLSADDGDLVKVQRIIYDNEVKVWVDPSFAEAFMQSDACLACGSNLEEIYDDEEDLS